MRPPTEFQSSQQKKSRRPSIDQKRGKAGGSSGIRAEHIENCDSETKWWIRQIFNEIVQQEDCTPQTWRIIRISVIHNNGNVEDAGNYCPMCSLPVLYKLFATALHASETGQMPPDQDGLRPSHQTVDHLMVYRMLEQRCREWGVPLYISTLDFTKACTLAS